MRFIFGFCFLLILPGFLILPLLNIQKIGFFEKCLLMIGISVGFVYFYGLAINTILLLIGYAQPLSSNSILLTFTFIYIILIILGRENEYYKDEGIRLLQLFLAEKKILVIPCILPAAILFSMYILKTQGNNILLLGSLIALFIFFIILLKKERINKNIFPLLIWLISFSLLSLFMFRYQFIWGNDIQTEFGLFFLTTYDNQYWTYLGGNLGTALSVTLLPAIINSICRLEYVELLFKSIYVFVCSFSPVAVYYAIKKYLDSFLAFCASLYFIFQINYLHTAGSPRTNIAIFFCAMTMYVLTTNRIENRAKSFLIILFLAAIVVSHYATAYIFFLILLVGALITNNIHETKFKNRINYSIIIIFFVIIISWNFLLLGSSSLISGLNIAIESLHEYLIPRDSDTYMQIPETVLLFNPEFTHYYLGFLQWLIYWTTFIFIGLGIVYSILFSIQKKLHLLTVGTKAIYTKIPEIGIEYIICAVVSMALLVSFIAFQPISSSYDSTRLFSLTALFLSPFLIIGIVYTIQHIPKILSLHKKFPHSHKIAEICIITLIIGYGLFALGLPYQIVGIQQSHLSQESMGYIQTNTLESEKFAAIWLKDNYDENTNIIPRMPGWKELWSAGRFSHKIIDTNYKDSYIYFRNYAIINGDYETYIVENWKNTPHKIFSNEGVKILYVIQ